MHVNPITRGTAERRLVIGTGALARRRKACSLTKAPTSHPSSGCLSETGEAILKYNLSIKSPQQGSFMTTNHGSDSTSCLCNVCHTGQGGGPVVWVVDNKCTLLYRNPCASVSKKTQNKTTCIRGTFMSHVLRGE